MAVTKLAAGQEIETLTPAELERHLDAQTRNSFQEMARGVSTFQVKDSAAVAAGAATFPTGTSEGYGPDAGFAWAITRLSVNNLATADVVKIYRDAVAPGNFVGQVTGAAPVAQFGTKGLILRGGQGILLQGTGLTATGFLYLTGEGMEIAETDIYKLL